VSRILFVSTSTTVGGAEKTLFNLATLLDHQAFQVAGAVSLKPEGEYARRLREAGVKVETLGAHSARPRDAKALAAIIRRERPDIVHALMYQAIQVQARQLPARELPHPFHADAGLRPLAEGPRRPGDLRGTVQR
jgi:hypothetical protein